MKIQKIITEAEMIQQAAKVQAVLNCCSFYPGAKVTISVEHDCGLKATAELYDHAALVQSLIDSLEYFIDEIKS